jgi:ABC-2 type transport system permease protein
MRDARLAVTYKISFALHWVAVLAGVIGLSFMSKLVSGNRHFGVGGMSYFEYAVINVAFLTLEISALDGCEKVVRNDQVYGTLPAILSTPTSMAIVAIGSTAWSFVFALIQIACYVLFGSLFGLRLDHIDPVSLSAFIVLAVAATVPLGILSTAMVIVFKQGAPVKFILSNAAAIFAGVLFPVALLPGWMQHVSWALPMTHVLNGVRGAFSGVTLARLEPDALWLAAASALLFPIALYTFRTAVARAKFDGTLSQY